MAKKKETPTLTQAYRSEQEENYGKLYNLYKNIMNSMDEFTDTVEAIGRDNYNFHLDPSITAKINEMRADLRISQREILHKAREAMKRHHMLMFVQQVRMTYGCSLSDLIRKEYDVNFTKELEEELLKGQT